MTQVGAFLEDGGEGLLLPKRFVPRDLKIGDTIEVFVYHDSENRLIATTQRPKAVVGEIALMRAVTVTKQGAFLDWGLMKDLFVPRSKQLSGMREGADYLVKVYIDEQTGRAAATEKIDFELDQVPMTLKVTEPVKLTVYRRSDIGYVVIINSLFTGVLHHNEIYRNISPGDTFEGYITHIRPDGKVDVAAGKPGYARVEDEVGKILRLLQENNGYLPFYDKSSPESIYDFFGMSKKTFKMVTGSLYKQQKIKFTETGIQLL